MTKKTRGLGRSLDSLLGTVSIAQPKVATNPSDASLQQLDLDLIQPGRYQPRRIFEPEALQDLAESIRKQGIVQPIVVRPIDQGRYEIIAGERRWRAAQLTDLKKVPALVRTLTDNEAVAIALIENIQRQDLNVVEEARAFQRLIDEFKMTHQEVAEAVGKSRAGISNFLRLLSLQKEVLFMLERSELEMGHAKVLLALQPADQLRAAKIVIARGLSVRETEALIKTLQTQKSVLAPARSTDPDIQKLQRRLSDHLGAMVTVDCNAKGRGKVVIAYNNLDELDGILSKMMETV